ncbi:MAG: N-acetylneuraminate synthase family protein [Planctomycetota bacterium]
MQTLGIILARAGSKGLPDKCVRLLRGRALIEYTLDHAAASSMLAGIVLTTDSEPAKQIARRRGMDVVDRPGELATDTATVDAAARHAVEQWERSRCTTVDVVVLLYGNIPVRAEGLIDRAIEHLRQTGCDSVRSVAPVTKQHPDWVHRLDGDRMIQFRSNSIYRRQDLDPLYYHDGAIVAVTRAALFEACKTPDDRQSFLGRDRRAIAQLPEDAVDVDTAVDLCLADAVLRMREGTSSPAHPTGTDLRQSPIVHRPSTTDNRQSTTDNRQSSTPAVVISGRKIGPGARIFIIAEAGVNHDGDVVQALRMVELAADAGVDAVKFQMFRADELTTACASTAAYQRSATGVASQRDLLRRLELSISDFARIRQHCDLFGVIFLATPFGIQDLERVMNLGVAAIKIASTDLNNFPLLDAAAATRKPLLMSIGASTPEEIRTSVDRLGAAGAADRLVLMHCVSSYPTPPSDANLRAIHAIHEAFGLPVGYSDHTTSTMTGAWAAAAGACVLEKHFTLNPSAAGPDHAMSLSVERLAEYVAHARQAEIALGGGEIGLTSREQQVRQVARKSIVAAASITAGTRLNASMLTLKRPGTGIPADAFDRLIGRTTAVDIPGDTTLSWEMLR